MIHLSPFNRVHRTDLVQVFMQVVIIIYYLTALIKYGCLGLQHELHANEDNEFNIIKITARD